MQNCASFGLTMPCHLEKVFWLRQTVIPTEVEQSGGANGARPPPAHTGLAWRKECCYPVSAPGGLGPCRPIPAPEHVPKHNQALCLPSHFTLCNAAGVCTPQCQHQYCVCMASVLIGAKLAEQHASWCTTINNSTSLHWSSRTEVDRAVPSHSSAVARTDFIYGTAPNLTMTIVAVHVLKVVTWYATALCR